MKHFFTAKVKVLLALTAVLAVVLALASSLGGTNGAEKGVLSILAPLRSGVHSLTAQAQRLYDYLFRYDSLLAENEALRARIAELEDEARSTDALQRENQRLKEIAGLKEERQDFDLISAYVMTWDSSDWTSTFTINKGSKLGIEPDMVVITSQRQVVGLVTEVGSNWAVVTTVLDSSLDISANISSSGYAGMVQGAYSTGHAGMLRMDYLPTSAVIRNHDQVVTTGSMLYPRDLILGYVADAGFDETGVAKYALLTPAADLESLEQVFVLTNYTSE